MLSVDASAVTAEMPKFLASLMLSLNMGYPLPTAKHAVSADAEDKKKFAEDGENDDFSDIDMDFIGG